MAKANHNKPNINKQDLDLIHDPVFTEHLLEKLNKSGMVVLSATGICVYVSSRAEQILHIKKDQLLQRDFFEVIPLVTMEGELIEERKHPVWRALQPTAFTQVTPFFCRRVGKDTELLAMNVMQVKRADKLLGVVVQVRKAEREVNLGEMKSLFLSFAAHQLKTPSSIVKGFLELMMREGEEAFAGEQWNYLVSAFESNEHLIQVSKSLLSMARLEGGLIEPQIHEFDPRHVLQAKIKSLSSLLAIKELSVKFEAEGETYINSDDTFLLEVFEIIFANAMKHSPNGALISVRCITTADEVTVHVIDQGNGVPAKVAENLFVNAQDTQASDNNSHGLGLFMAKKYLALLGGSIGVESGPQGSDFYFTIPNAVL